MVILLFSMVLCAKISTDFILRTQNTLEKNGDWIVSKRSLAYPTMGANGYYTGRQTLRRNRLDLGAWHGYQEVIFDTLITPRKVSFRALLVEESYLVYEYNRNPDSEYYEGIRISNNSDYPSAYLKVSNSGEFLEKRTLDIPGVEIGTWIKFHIVHHSDSLNVTIDDTISFSMPMTVSGRQKIGFRNGYFPVLIDDIEIRLHDDSIIKEDFSNRENSVRVFIGLIIILFMISVIFMRINRRFSFNEYLISAITLHVLLCFVMVVVGVCYDRIYSRNYPFEGEEIYETEVQWIAHQTDTELAEIQESMKASIPDSVITILFMGASQTWGMGALKSGDTFVTITETNLNAMNGFGNRFRCINFGVCGQDSYGLTRRYMDLISDTEFDVVCINLSHNDRDPVLFYENLHTIGELNKDRGIATIFILEPACPTRYPHELPYHYVMRNLADELGIPVVEMHEYLKRKYDDGFLWWDYVHPTSFGHRLMGEKLALEISSILSTEYQHELIRNRLNSENLP